MATVCIYSMSLPIEGKAVNWTAKFCVPRTVSLEEFVINFTEQQCVVVLGSFKRRLATYLLVMVNDEHHPALLGRFFVIMASSINVETYLFTDRTYLVKVVTALSNVHSERTDKTL